jgi:NTP pyrophosphatase (non-canonical NTP hydrolase)
LQISSSELKAHMDTIRSIRDRMWENDGLADRVTEEMMSAFEEHKDHTPYNRTMIPDKKLTILVEEVGEVARAITYDEGSKAKLMEELIDVIAMAGMWWMSLVEDSDGA